MTRTESLQERLQKADAAAREAAEKTNGDPYAVFGAWAEAMGYDLDNHRDRALAVELYGRVGDDGGRAK